MTKIICLIKAVKNEKAGQRELDLELLKRVVDLTNHQLDLESNTDDEVYFINTSKKTYPKKYFVHIPQNLNIDELVSSYPPNIEKFHKDKLKYMISLIYSIPIRLKDFDFELEDGFIPINSEVAKFRVSEYNKYLEYLEEVGVFEKRKDYKYKPGEKSSGFRFTQEFNTNSKRTTITKKPLIKKICTIHRKEEEIYVDTSKNDLEYLEKWWNDKLQFDYNGAVMWLDSELIKEQKQNKKHCERRYYVRRLVVEKLKNREYILHQDSTTGRVHSLFTQLKSELRQFVKYDGKTLVAVDIKNSQPYLAVSLLDKNRIIKTGMIDRIKHYNSRHDIISSIMLTLSEETEQKQDVKDFIEFVSTGQFYEMFGKLLLEKGLIDKTDKDAQRKIAKKIMFSSMFGHNNEKCAKRNPETGKIWYFSNEGMILFKETFPTVFEIFKKIKTGKHNTLACILQNLEAELVLHRACRIIHEERPDVLTYTLHDSIITTEDNAMYVKRVLSDVLLDNIGIAPEISLEYWRKKVA